MGVVIDGCPAGLTLSEEDIHRALQKRACGLTPFTSPRKEKDLAQILSGVFEGKTTGAPLSLMIVNNTFDSSPYEAIKHLLRPGHANFTYLHKYGIFDYRGGGRSSGRETACRVAAAAVAKKLLDQHNIVFTAYLRQVGPIGIKLVDRDYLARSPIFCPDEQACQAIQTLISQVKQEGDSLGACVECIVQGLPVGLGDPVYEKLEANLAKAMLSIPASKGFEIGAGFAAVGMRGSEHNDAFGACHKTNHAGGTLGGISTGEDLTFRVAFKPTSSIKIPQETLTLDGEKANFTLPPGSKHDPCLGIRAVSVVEAMAALVIVDALLAPFAKCEAQNFSKSSRVEF